MLQQLWLNTVIDHLEVRPEKTRIGMVSFSDTAVKEFDLDTFKRKEDLKQVSKICNISKFFIYKFSLRYFMKMEVYLREGHYYMSNLSTFLVICFVGSTYDKIHTRKDQPSFCHQCDAFHV